MTVEEAEDYHAEQINWFAETEADMVITPYSLKGTDSIKIDLKK
jgi:hypothetical protein